MWVGKVRPFIVLVVLVAITVGASQGSSIEYQRKSARHWRSKTQEPPQTPPFFAGNKRPEGLPNISRGVEIQQTLPDDPNGTAPYFVSLFDPDRNIPFYAAYKVTPQQAPFIGKYKRKDVKRRWRNPPGVTGFDAAYKELIRKEPLSRGHMDPLAINSFDKRFMEATYTYTNAAPQYVASNSGPWQLFEAKVRWYAQNICSGRSCGGTLYLLTGTSDFGLGTNLLDKPTQEDTTSKLSHVATFPGEVKLVIPRAIWTAACCVWKDGTLREQLKTLTEKVDTNASNIQRYVDDTHQTVSQRLDERHQHCKDLEDVLGRHNETHLQIHSKMDSHREDFETRHSQLEAHLQKQDEDLHKEVNDRIDGVERHHSNLSKENAKRLNALDLRIAGLQGASGESKRDVGKLRDEVNNLTVKSAAHDVDIGKNSDDLRKLERQRAEDNQRHKQDVDGIYEELDQKVYEKNFQTLEDNVTKLTRGTVKLCQVVGVFPGARMNDGTEEELHVDVELLNWEDCAQNLVSRVDKTWRQVSSQKYRSILDLLGKKADHSVLRLLQISQQHIESQLDRVRHERELWKEVVDKRAQQPLQLALTLKDPHTGQPLPGPPGYGLPGLDGNAMGGQLSARGLPAMTADPMMQLGPAGQGMADQPKASPLAKRIARPSPQGPPAPKAS